jgi:hypothetical protein
MAPDQRDMRSLRRPLVPQRCSDSRRPRDRRFGQGHQDLRFVDTAFSALSGLSLLAVLLPQLLQERLQGRMLPGLTDERAEGLPVLVREVNADLEPLEP